MNNNRYYVIMCGGIGSRFWPYSRAYYPKQFIDFLGIGRSLLQLSYDRMKGIVPDENIVVVANRNYKDLIKQQLPFLSDSNILLEPARRNTAPCIAWATNHIKALNPDATIMVAPSDHLILKEEEFRTNVEAAFSFVEQNDALLTFGLKPQRPETGYGYIQIDNNIGGNFYKVKTFTEKPNLELAKVFISTGEFLWNSGIFFWKASVISEALRTYAPEISTILERGAKEYGTPEEISFINSEFSDCPSISIDFAVMEKAKNVYVESVDFGWSDLGTWGALYEQSSHDDKGNAVSNCGASFYDSSNNIITSKNPEKMIVAVGMNGYIIADSNDVLLICPLGEEEKIKHFANDLKIKFGDKFQ